MRPEFSEFSYGFALSREIMNLPGVTGTPLLPSTREEGKSGFDFMVTRDGIPTFYQYKLADYMQRPNSKHIKDGSCKEPYYRIYIYNQKRSKQHNILRELSNKGNLVYYAAPTFHLRKDLDKNFTLNKIYEASVFVNLSRLPIIKDNADHHIIVPENNIPDSCWRSSEYEKIGEDISGKSWLFYMSEIILECDERKLGIKYILELYSQLFQILSRSNTNVSYYKQLIEFSEFVNKLRIFDDKLSIKNIPEFSNKLVEDFNVYTIDDLEIYCEHKDYNSIKFKNICDNFIKIFNNLRAFLFIYFGVEPIVLKKSR